ncbi:MAG TPA: pyridoxal-phosphate dependent enzyme [Capsulimonadaceae bacterium]|nr:pyridoxal-phosphate dependent enzyme [Capsulimonadaceae bacterium]
MQSPVRPTTIIHAPRLSERLGVDLVLASETFQMTGSFKFRAACHLVGQVAATRIIAASSGNFGQALACACQLAGKNCTIVMPDTSSAVKVEAVRAWGGEVDMIDTSRISRAERVAELAAADPQAYVASAYDDPFVIAGNSTLGAELAALDPMPDAILVPVGGGGLSSGVITGLRGAGASVPVFGAEPALANDAARSLAAGRLIKNEAEPPTIADGARTVSLGQRNWKILKTGLAGIIEVSEEQIAEAVLLLFLLANLKAEPTGALSLGALLAEPGRFAGRRICCVVSGGNVDPALYARLISGPAQG